MVNITPATVTPASLLTAADVAEVDAVLAATRSLAGFGAGAFTCGSGQIGAAQTGSIQQTSIQQTPAQGGGASAASALPRVRRVFGPSGLGHAGGVGVGAYQPSLVSTKQNNQMTRINPVTPGGLGPHPVREPVPV